ncbi:MAG: acyltransferase [Geminicoccaceae bacterium]|nr:MAG: acyltransferase [Geminicoccaceae bacterium]
MKVTLKLPRLSANMNEAVVVKWHKQPGEAFAEGEALYDVETEKVTATVEAPCEGKLLQVLVSDDQDIEVGDPVCRIEKAG